MRVIYTSKGMSKKFGVRVIYRKIRYFVTKNSSSIDFDIIHGNKKIANVYNTKFLGLILDNTLSWRTHIDIITPKLSQLVLH